MPTSCARACLAYIGLMFYLSKRSWVDLRQQLRASAFVTVWLSEAVRVNGFEETGWAAEGGRVDGRGVHARNFSACECHACAHRFAAQIRAQSAVAINTRAMSKQVGSTHMEGMEGAVGARAYPCKLKFTVV
eukprot:2941675-Pleurochrysis_carterae.AAC.5